MKNLHSTCARSALWLALGLSMAVPAMAQSADAPERIQETAEEDAAVQQRVVVTGSFIAGTPEDSALPVDVYGRAELEETGISSPLELIKSLPSVGSVLGDSNQFAPGAQGSQGSGSINMRNLGATRNLVLLNGHRTIASPGDGFADTQLIPMFALERVELLKQGAAATYGSDAISGVANFITRTSFEGLELSGDYTAIDGSDGDFEVSALWGHNFENGNIMVGIGHQARSELSNLERDFVFQPFSTNPAGWSVLGNPATYLPYLGDISQGQGGTALGVGIDGLGPAGNACVDTGGEVGSTSGVPICRFSYIPFGNLVEDTERTQIYAQFDADLSPEFRINANALWAQTHQNANRYSPTFPPTQGPNGPGSSFAFFVPSSNPGYQGFIDQSLNLSTGLPFAGSVADPTGPTAQALGTYAAILLGRPVGAGGIEELTGGLGGGIGKAENDAFRMSAGFEWDVTEDSTWTNDITFYQSRRLFWTPDTVGSRMQSALEGFGGPDCDRTTGTAGVGDCLYFNPFINSQASNPALGLNNANYIPGNENSAAVLGWMVQPNGTEQQEDVVIIDSVYAGVTDFDLGAGNIAYAVGGQYRHSNFRSDPINDLSNAAINPCGVEGDNSCLTNGAVQTGPFVFLGQTTESRLQQSVYAAFAEVQIPLLDTLEATVALRYEDYGGQVGATTDPKVSVRWEANDYLVVRGSAGTTFRGPLPSNILNGNTATTLAGIQAAGNNFKSVDIYGNPALAPESAFTYNIGAVFNYEGFQASFDYWSYDFEDEITTTPAQGIANLVANGPGNGTQLVDCTHPLAYLVTFQGGCTQGVTIGSDISRVRTDIINGPGIKTSGIDFTASYGWDLGPGFMEVGGSSTYTLEYDVRDIAINGVVVTPGYDAVGFANFARSAPAISDLKGNLYANYNMDAWNFRYQMEYISGVEDTRAGIIYGADGEDFIQHDLHVFWEVPVEFADVSITGSIENITDEDPAAAQLELSYNPFVGNALGRTFSIGATINY
ncbi:TonB-dependent receptor domain-containing protein [Ponticaulis koreensis]|uniref:TonB-dependent receptor domain-containing protein n=1 Tax=Ponticaulis koreensis TaxID=1123045 RepID=UPI0003B521E0|nr:TonB-dependent receptor [Ponticaulis koreensis]